MKHDGLSKDQHKAIQAARRAFGEALTMNAASMDEATVLAMVAHAGSFADILSAGRNTGMAQALVDLTNEQLASAGYRLVAMRQ